MLANEFCNFQINRVILNTWRTPNLWATEFYLNCEGMPSVIYFVLSYAPREGKISANISSPHTFCALAFQFPCINLNIKQGNDENTFSFPIWTYTHSCWNDHLFRLLFLITRLFCCVRKIFSYGAFVMLQQYFVKANKSDFFSFKIKC